MVSLTTVFAVKGCFGAVGRSSSPLMTAREEMYRMSHLAVLVQMHYSVVLVDMHRLGELESTHHHEIDPCTWTGPTAAGL